MLLTAAAFLAGEVTVAGVAHLGPDAADAASTKVKPPKKPKPPKKENPNKGVLDVMAPADDVIFPEVKLDGGASYKLAGDLGDWVVSDDTGKKTGWQVTVAATDAIAYDTDLPLAGSILRMRVPVPSGVGAAPTVAAGDANGFVTLNGSSAPDGSVVARSATGGSPGLWTMTQPGPDDLKLTMPFDTRAQQYDMTVTFTVSPPL